MSALKRHGWAIGTVAGMAAVLLLIALNMASIAGFAATRALAAAGFPDARLGVREIGFTHVVFTDLDLGIGSDAGAAEMQIEFSPGRLAKGIIDGIRLVERRIAVALALDRISFGPLDRFVGGSAGEQGRESSGSVRIIGPVSFERARIAAATPMGSITAGLDGEVILTDGLGTTANFRFALDHPDAAVAGEAKAVLDPDGRIRAGIDIARASSRAHVAFSDLIGKATLDGNLPLAVTGGIEFRVRDLAVDGVPLGGLDATVHLDGGGLAAEFAIGGADTGLSAAFRARTDNTFEPHAAWTVGGQIATDGLRGPFQLPAGMDAVGGLSFEVTGARDDLRRLPGLAAAGRNLFTAAPVDGWVDADFVGLSVPAASLDLTLRGRSEFRVGPDGWRVDPLERLEIDTGVGSRTFAANVTSSGDAPMALAGAGANDPVRLAFAFDGTFDGKRRIRGDVAGAFRPGGPDGPRVDDATIRLQPLLQKIAGMDFAVQGLTVRLAGGMKGLSAHVAGKTTFAGVPSPGVAIEGGQAVFDGKLGYSSGRLTLAPEGCSSANAVRIAGAGVEVRPGPISICPPGDGRPLIDVDLGDDGPRLVKVAFGMPSVEVAIKGLGPYPLAGPLPRLDAGLTVDLKRGTWWGKARAEGGAVGVDALDVLAGPLSAVLDFEGKDRLLSFAADIASARLADRRRPARLAPLTLSGKAAYKGDAVAFNGSLATAIGGLKATLALRHRTRDGRGDLSVLLPVTALQPQAAPIEALAPVLKGIVTDVQGSVGADVRLDWTGDRLRSAGRFALKDIAFGSQMAEVAGVGGEIVLTDLLTPTTDGPQRIGVGFIDAGLRLKDGEVVFRLPGDGTLVLDRLAWPFAGGDIGVQGLTTALGSTPQFVEAKVTDVNGRSLSELAAVDGLAIAGRFTGSVPLHLDESGAVIENGVIESIGGGTIRYSAATAAAALAAGGGSGELLAKALANFQFSQLKLTLAGPLAGKMTAKTAIKGSNPDLYDGKKIELNVDLQGDLRELLQSVSVLKDLPAPIRERIERRAGRP